MWIGFITAAEMWIVFINGSRSVDIFTNGSRATVSTAAVGFFLCSLYGGGGATIYKVLVAKSEVGYRSSFRGIISKFRVLKMVLPVKNKICTERKEDLQEHLMS